MSMAYLIYADLQFADQSAIEAAERDLEEEGCLDCEDNPITQEDLRWIGTRLQVRMEGSMPYSCFMTAPCVLRCYATHAKSGEVYLLNIEDGEGERIVAGGDSDDFEEEEVESLRPKVEALIRA